MELNKSSLIAAGVGIGTLIAVYIIANASAAKAADFGGGCCADLEERIAELEATAARKGNRKVSLRVYGTVNKALLVTGGDLDSNQVVTENSNDESFVGFAGEARISQAWKAGYVLEIGVGGYDAGLTGGGFGYGPLLGGNTNDIYTRRSFVYVDGPVGKVSLGLASQATDEISQLSLANTQVSARMLSLRPIIGPNILEVADVFDGTRTDVVRYDSPVFAGAVVSASWASGSFGTDDVWDVAFRWAGEGAGFRVLAGVGYKQGLVIPTIANIGSKDIETISGSVSVKHIETGLFANAAYGDLTLGPIDLQAYHFQGGVERKWSTLGATTIYAEAADASDIDLKIYGLGLVQNIEAAAMDLYITGRRLEIGGNDADLVMIGAKVQF